MASDLIASSNLSFAQIELFIAPYVFAVSKGLDFFRASDPEADLFGEDFATLCNIIRFEFGNQHKRWFKEWYQGILPKAWTEASLRTYEVAPSMVHFGLGVVPALIAEISPGHGFRVGLYRTSLRDRRMMALLPEQYVRIEPRKTFLGALTEAERVRGQTHLTRQQAE